MLLLVLVVLLPVSREWVTYGLAGARGPIPKGWPSGEARWRDWDKPTDPRERAAYEYAHALKLPPSMPEVVPFDFKRHLLSNRMTTARAYFDHLCATEAGEYIFRTVEKVDGLYQMRAMPKRSDKLLRDRYGFEDPADWSAYEASGSPHNFLAGRTRGFRYFESARSPDQLAELAGRNGIVVIQQDDKDLEEPNFWRYQNFDNHGHGEAIQGAQLNSRYAYTWRGIRRDRDREYGIAGGELIVLDRVTGEILGVRRSFSIVKQYATHLDWEFAYFCPGSLSLIDGSKRVVRKLEYPYSFVMQVLRPIDFGLKEREK